MNEPDFLELMKECLRENADSKKSEESHTTQTAQTAQGGVARGGSQTTRDGNGKPNMNRNNSSKTTLTPVGPGEHPSLLFALSFMLYTLCCPLYFPRLTQIWHKIIPALNKTQLVLYLINFLFSLSHTIYFTPFSW